MPPVTYPVYPVKTVICISNQVTTQPLNIFDLVNSKIR